MAIGMLNARYITHGCTPNSGATMWAIVHTSAADQMMKVKMLNGLTSTRSGSPKRFCSICGCEIALIDRTLGTNATMQNRRMDQGITITQIPPRPYM